MIDEDPKPIIRTAPAKGAGGGGFSGVTTSPSSAGFHINLIWDSSTNSAPSGFKAQVQQAADIIQSMFTNNITANITVGWGEIGGQLITPGAAEALGGPYEYALTYAQLKTDLTRSATSADDSTSIAHMPLADPYAGSGADWLISTAQAKLFGVFSSTDPATDGEIGFGTGWTSDWVGGALHELTHALGRIQGASLDLFRYSSAGHFQFVPGRAAYFSIDGGATDLANFGVSSDPGDWRNYDTLTPHDPFDEIISSDTWTALDSKVMDVLGFTLAGQGQPGLPDLTASSLAFHGGAVSWTVSNGGGSGAGASTAGVYLSTDKTITTSDIPVGTYATPSLGASASDAESLVLNLPHNLAAGTYYLGVIADQGGAVTEANEANNVSNLVPLILGNDNNNTLRGTSGSDILIGMGGKDVLNGGAGADILIGGAGQDTLTGGAGADAFVFTAIGDSTTSAPDLITDFTHGQDKIDLSSIDANTALAGHQAFHFGATPGHTGDIVTHYDAAHNRTVIDLYVNADATRDSEIWLSGNHALTASDFLL